jgi:hypothetical protein
MSVPKLLLKLKPACQTVFNYQLLLNERHRLFLSHADRCVNKQHVIEYRKQLELVSKHVIPVLHG